MKCVLFEYSSFFGGEEEYFFNRLSRSGLEPQGMKSVLLFSGSGLRRTRRKKKLKYEMISLKISI